MYERTPTGRDGHATARQEIPWSPEWELPWHEQSLASRAAQAVEVATSLLDKVDGDVWAGNINQARDLLGALREVESALLDGFAEGWGDAGRFLVAKLRQEITR
jgi:hypothetical protein